MIFLYSHPREYRKKHFLANYLCIGFVPGGILALLYSNLTAADLLRILDGPIRANRLPEVF